MRIEQARTIQRTAERIIKVEKNNRLGGVTDHSRATDLDAAP